MFVCVWNRSELKWRNCKKCPNLIKWKGFAKLFGGTYFKDSFLPFLWEIRIWFSNQKQIQKYTYTFVPRWRAFLQNWILHFSPNYNLSCSCHNPNLATIQSKRAKSFAKLYIHIEPCPGPGPGSIIPTPVEWYLKRRQRERRRKNKRQRPKRDLDIVTLAMSFLHICKTKYQIKYKCWIINSGYL